MLLRTLRELLENKDVQDNVSFQAAIVLSNCTHFEQLYEERLRQTLTNGPLDQQSLVSCYESTGYEYYIFIANIFATKIIINNNIHVFNFINF